MKESKTTAIATLGQNDIPKMLGQVEEQIKLIKKGLPTAPKTNKELTPFGKIDNINKLDTIIQATSMVIGKAKAYKEAATLVVPEGVKTPTFTINGMKEQDMLNHLKVRAVEVGNKEKLDKLNKVKAKLEANLSAEAKLAKDLADIQNILTDEE